eukprot:1158404-Pelagomonas_calceolata.AAC.3
MGTFGKTMRRIMPAIIDTCLLLPKEECDIKYSCATTRVHAQLLTCPPFVHYRSQMLHNSNTYKRNTS